MKIINSFANLYNTCIEHFHPFIAILFCIFFGLIGLAIGLGIDYLIAIGLAYIYNILAQNFNWPIFSTWFWFIGVLILVQILKITSPNKEVE